MPSVDCRFPGRGGESGLDLPQPGEEMPALALVEVALLDGMKHQVALWVTPLRWWIIAMAGKPVLTSVVSGRVTVSGPSKGVNPCWACSKRVNTAGSA